jgi:hypothetical protein
MVSEPQRKTPLISFFFLDPSILVHSPWTSLLYQILFHRPLLYWYTQTDAFNCYYFKLNQLFRGSDKKIEPLNKWQLNLSFRTSLVVLKYIIDSLCLIIRNTAPNFVEACISQVVLRDERRSITRECCTEARFVRCYRFGYTNGDAMKYWRRRLEEDKGQWNEPIDDEEASWLTVEQRERVIALGVGEKVWSWERVGRSIIASSPAKSSPVHLLITHLLMDPSYFHGSLQYENMIDLKRNSIPFAYHNDPFTQFDGEYEEG